MFYIIEVKKYNDIKAPQMKNNFQKKANKFNESNLYKDIQQNFQQLRSYCIESNINKVYGIMTNF